MSLSFGLCTSVAAQVSGRVVDASSSAGITGATILLIGAGAQHHTRSAEDGSYEVRDIAPAEYALLVMHPAYDEVRLRVTVRAGSVMTVDLPLEPRPVALPQLLVHGERGVRLTGTDTAALDGPPSTSSDARWELVRPQTAGALADLVLAAATREPPRDAPGSRRPHVLYIWGSSAERGRVLLDGATLNAPLHLGGILPSLDPELLERAELRTGGASSRYDGGTTYVMDFETRVPSSPVFRSRGEVDLLAARAWAEAPLSPAGGMLVGARRVNDELVQSVLERPFGYAYADALARFDQRVGAAGRLSATTLATREVVRLPRDHGEDEAGWQNLAAALSWRSSQDPTGVRATVSASRGLAELPLLSAPEGFLRATLDRYAATAGRGWTSGRTELYAGADVEHLRFARHSGASNDPRQPELTNPVTCTPSLPCAATAATRLSAFADAAWQPALRLSTRAGVRATYWPAAGSVSLLPRLVLTLVDATGTTAATISAGRFSQVNSSEAYGPSRSFATGSQHGDQPLTTSVTHATQLELQVTRRSSRTTLELSAFLRHHERMAAIAALTVPGGDVSFAYTDGPTTVGFGYSMFGRRAATSPATPEYQHLAAASVATAQGRFGLRLAAAYGQGLPLTSIVLDRPVTTTGGLPGPAAGDLDDRAFFRIDALLSAEWTLSAGGRNVQVVPYAKLVNGLNRREALFYVQDGSAVGEPQPVAALAALPVLGVRWSF